MASPNACDVIREARAVALHGMNVQKAARDVDGYCSFLVT